MSAADGRLPCRFENVCVYVYLVRGMYALKYSFTVAPAPRRG